MIKNYFFKTGLLLFALVGLFSCNPKNNSPNTEYRDISDKLLDAKQQQLLYDAYTAKNYKLINSSRPENTPDSREYTYSVEELEAYINFVKTEAAKKGLKNMGISLKMGQYPEDQLISPTEDPEYKGYQTVYLVPVKDFIPDKNTVAVQRTSSTNAVMDDTGIPGMDYSRPTPP